MRTMPPKGTLSDLEERILLALWKLRGIGKNTINERILKADLAAESESEGWMEKIRSLNNQGFLEMGNVDGQNSFSLTALGLAILRRIEEDRLQELK